MWELKKISVKNICVKIINLLSLEHVCDRVDTLVESMVDWSDMYNIPCSGRDGEPLNEYVSRKAEIILSKIKNRLKSKDLYCT